MAQNWSRPAIRAPRSRSGAQRWMRAGHGRDQALPGGRGREDAPARSGPGRRRGRCDAWSSHRPSVRFRSRRAQPDGRDRARVAHDEAGRLGQGGVVLEVDRPIDAGPGRRPARRLRDVGRRRLDDAGSVVPERVRRDLEVEQRPPRPHARPGCTGQAPARPSSENVIRSAAPSRARPAAAARHLATGALDRRTGRSGTARPPRPTGTEPPKPDDVRRRPARRVRARATRCSRYGQPSCGRSGQSIGSPLAARIAAIGRDVFRSSPADVHRPAAAIDFARAGHAGCAWAVMPSRPTTVVRRHERVDDRLLGRLDRRVEESVDDDIADPLDVEGAGARRRRRRRRSMGKRLPVEKAMNRSPLVCPPVPPTRAMPRPARWASRSHWWGSSGASVATTTMIEPEPGRRHPARAARHTGSRPRRSGSPRRRARHRCGASRRLP